MARIDVVGMIREPGMEHTLWGVPVFPDHNTFYVNGLYRKSNDPGRQNPVIFRSLRWLVTLTCSSCYRIGLGR